MPAKFEKLFSPIKVGPIEFRNRIVLPAMQSGLAARDGSATDRLVAYLEEKAKGGAGLIITEFAHVDNKGSQYAHCQLAIYDDSFIPRLNNVADAIQAHGAKAGVQITHCGMYNQVKREYHTVAPSAIPSTYGVEPPRELTVDEIKEIIAAFGEAARRVKDAGFNLVELDGAHGYLIPQFMSPRTNKRVDEYGGTFERRMRFPIEICETVRSKMGSDLALSFRISGDDFMEGGMKIGDTKTAMRMLEKTGVDIFHVSAGTRETPGIAVLPMYVPTGYHVHLAEEAKKVLSVPVMAVGAINDPFIAEEILREGKADMVAMGRALVADPYLPKKAMEGRFDDILKCIRCNDGCDLRSYQSRDIWCTVNPLSGREKEWAIVKADKPKNVLIIGAGPAGMEAARIAALRGHKVTLYEKDKELGGYLRIASIPEFKKELENLNRYYENQLKKLKVKVMLGTEANTNTIARKKPDAIIIATGSEPFLPKLPGINKRSVITGVDVLTGRKKVKGTVLVVGAGFVGCEVALFLAKRESKVTVIDMLPDMATTSDPGVKEILEKEFKTYGIKFSPNLTLEEITEEGGIVRTKDNQRQLMRANNVILGMGFISQRKLLDEARKKYPNVYAIGDCVKPRKIYDAIHEGFNVGRII